MKLLVFAHPPPPVHGQSLMVATLLDGLRGAPGFEVFHVNPRVSRDAADIGRVRPGKLLALLAACARALALRARHGPMVFYYVPAPGRRSALYRDWLVMLLCRPLFPKLVLHWHATGLAAWLENDATALERILTHALLGRAALALALAESLRADADGLRARRVAIVPNGLAAPAAPAPPPAAGPCRVLFLGLCSEQKGLFNAATAVIEANRRAGAPAAQPAFVLTAAGAFADDAAAARFGELARAHPLALNYAGVVAGAAKARLFAECHLVCLPSRYAAEGQPLVLLEALAHDRPILATRWRGIPDIVTPEVGALVAPGDDAALADALLALRAQPPAAGVCRARFLARYTVEQHLAALADALLATSP
jgi:glycosyltransferase involved in cell wall biosynthesis